MADLRTDYKDDLLDTSVNTQRKYRMVTNDDGTVSFVDETVYTQNGDTFGASEVNKIHAVVNLVNDSLKVDTTNLSDDFTLNGLLQMLAEQYFPSANYLYKDGTMNTPLTAFGTDGTNGSTNFETNSIAIVANGTANAGRRQGVRTTNTFNLTGYSKIYLDATAVSGGKAKYWIGLSSTVPSGDIYTEMLSKNEVSYVTAPANNTVEFDVTAYQGSYYIYFGVLTQDTVAVTAEFTKIYCN